MNPVRTLSIPALASLPLDVLPSVIPVPLRVGDPTSQWIEKPLGEVTLSQLDAYLSHLDAAITANTRHHEALTAWCDRALGSGANFVMQPGIPEDR
jgi:hypothetical protein